jgi:hypothetical protein
MKYLVRFYQDKKVIFSREVITDNIIKLTEYVKSTSLFLQTKHSEAFINYEIVKVTV